MYTNILEITLYKTIPFLIFSFKKNEIHKIKH
jgi:hypothetical protein